MEQKLLIIAFVAVPCLLVYLLSMRLTPHRGLLRVCEKLFIGIAVVYALNLALSPFRLSLAQNPLTSLAAGYLGLPGAVLVFVVQRLL